MATDPRKLPRLIIMNITRKQLRQIIKEAIGDDSAGWPSVPPNYEDAPPRFIRTRDRGTIKAYPGDPDYDKTQKSGEEYREEAKLSQAAQERTMTYKQWVEAVMRIMGLKEPKMIPDVSTYDAYLNNVTPEQYAQLTGESKTQGSI